MEDKEDWKSDWITLEEEGASNDFVYNPGFVERIEEIHATYDLREIMYPESKEAEEPAIMNDVEAFRYGFKFPESAHRSLTKSTLTKILKNFVSFSSLTDIPIEKRSIRLPADFDFVHNELVHSTVMFLTQLFDLESVREQVKAYLSNPYTHKGF